jgi:glycosyltransferase involved in cell wall biosynthesis
VQPEKVADQRLAPFIGIDPPEVEHVAARRGRVTAGLKAGGYTLPASGYVLYLGRVDPNKGCETLFRHFLRLHDAWPSEVPRLPLVLAGPANMPVPDHPMIRSLGYVTDEVRDALLAHATVLVVPSPYESLSIALLEAWNHGVPALVNGRCSVLKGQARRSDGALYYRDFDEFAHGLRYLLTHDLDRHQLGRQGRAYIDREYRWPHVMETLEAFLASLPPVTESPQR